MKSITTQHTEQRGKVALAYDNVLGAFTGSVHAVERALDLLEELATAEAPVGVSALSAATGQPAGTVHRLLATLTARGWVVRDERTRRYALGPLARALGRARETLPDLADVAPPFLRKVMEISGETANLALLDRDRAVYVAQVPCARTVRMFTELGNRVPLHCTGCGKVLLAHQDDEFIASLLSTQGLQRFTGKSITNPDRFWAEISAIRQRQYAIDDEEFEDGVRCLAVPVRDCSDRVIGALSVSGPSSRLDLERLAGLVPHLARAGAGLSSAISGASGG